MDLPDVLERVLDGLDAEQRLREINNKLSRMYFELGFNLGAGGVPRKDAIEHFEKLRKDHK